MPLTGVDGRFVFCPLTMTPVQRITAEIRHLTDIFKDGRWWSILID